MSAPDPHLDLEAPRIVPAGDAGALRDRADVALLAVDRASNAIVDGRGAAALLALGTARRELGAAVAKLGQLSQVAP
jgi:hypothetical protein